MLRRAGNHLPEGSPPREELKEVQGIAQATLNNIERLPKPCIQFLEEAGLEALWTGIFPCGAPGRPTLHYERRESLTRGTGAGVHVYRVLQESAE